jgi:hypothetical protein
MSLELRNGPVTWRAALGPALAGRSPIARRPDAEQRFAMRPHGAIIMPAAWRTSRSTRRQPPGAEEPSTNLPPRTTVPQSQIVGQAGVAPAVAHLRCETKPPRGWTILGPAIAWPPPIAQQAAMCAQASQACDSPCPRTGIVIRAVWQAGIGPPAAAVERGAVHQRVLVS